MSTARDELRNGLLLDALGKPLDLNAVDWHVRHRNPSAPVECTRPRRGDDSSARPVGEKDERFVAWNKSLDHSIHKISYDYVKHYDDPERWMFSAWLSLTAKGELLARSIEEKDIDSYRGRGL